MAERKEFWWISIFGDEPQPAEVTFVGQIPAQAFVIGSANPLDPREFSLTEQLASPAEE